MRLFMFFFFFLSFKSKKNTDGVAELKQQLELSFSLDGDVDRRFSPENMSIVRSGS